MDLNNTWGEEEIVEDETYEDDDEEEEEDDEVEMGDDEVEDDDEDLDSSTEMTSLSYSVYRKKYNLLLERCSAIQQDNELLVSRVKEVNKLCKRGLRERKLLINKLDSYGDNFRNVPIVFPVEEEVAKKVKDKKLKRGLEESTGTSGRGRKQRGDKDKPARDPNLPKRPQNPFFQFCKEKRDTVAQDVFTGQGVNLTKKELTKILANQWNSLDSNDKMIYNERFEEEKAGYNIKMEVYRKQRDQADQNLNSLHNSPESLSLLTSSLGNNFDYEDSFDC